MSDVKPPPEMGTIEALSYLRIALEALEADNCYTKRDGRGR